MRGDEVIGLAGVGRMGQAIAGRLLEADVELIVWNRDPARCEPLVERGAEMADSLGELTERVDLVLLCLSDAAAVEEVVFGEDGIAAYGAEDQILVDLSGIEPEATRRFARELDQLCGMAWVDAPLAGDVQDAEDGELIVVAGGREEDVERVRPVLGAFSRRVTRMGDTGTGQATRLCHQALAGATLLALGEAVAYAERSGVDAERIPEALAGAAAVAPLAQGVGERMAVRQFEPVFADIGTLLRDLDTIVRSGREAGAALPLAALGAQLLRQHALRTGADEDLATLIELYTE